MLGIARAALPRATLVHRAVEDPLPDGPFGVVVAAFSVHHLSG